MGKALCSHVNEKTFFTLAIRKRQKEIEEFAKMKVTCSGNCSFKQIVMIKRKLIENRREKIRKLLRGEEVSNVRYSVTVMVYLPQDTLLNV